MTFAVATAILIALSVAVIVALLKPALLAPLLILVGGLLTEPNLWAAQYPTVGLPIMLAGAVVAIVQDGLSPSILHRSLSPVRSVGFWLTASSVWLVVRAMLFEDGAVAGSYLYLTGIIVGCIVAVSIVVADAERARILAKLFVAVVVLSCASFVLTCALWAIGGVGSFTVTHITVGSWPGLHPVYAPFTPTISQLQIGGLTLPRFTGIGREPGWMALYATMCIFISPILGWKSRTLRFILIAGLIGTASTAGFGVLVAAITLRSFVRYRAASESANALRTLVYIVIAGAALGVAVFAPVLGLASKSEVNAESLSERSVATEAGISALLTNPFPGGQGAEVVGAVNLLAAVAAYGIIFSITILLSVLMPLRGHPNKRALLVLVVVPALTFMTSQPAFYSIWAFCLVALAAALTRTSDQGLSHERAKRSDPLPSRSRERRHSQRLSASSSRA